MNSNFSERTAAFWSWFEKNEEKLADMAAAPGSFKGDEVITAFSEGVNLISENICFNVGRDYEFTFAVNGRSYLHYLLPHIVANMPEQYLDKWHFYSCMQGTHGSSFGLNMFGVKIEADKVMVSFSAKEGAKRADVKFYHKELASLPEDKCYQAFFTLMEHAAGEAFVHSCVGEVKLAKARGFGHKMFPLTLLEEKLAAAFCEDGEKQDPSEKFFIYNKQPGEGSVPRDDIFTGSGSYSAIINDYYAGDSKGFLDFTVCGAVPVFLFYEYDFELERGVALDERYEIMDKIEAEIIGKRKSCDKLGLILGGAMGTKRAYIDMLLYDFDAFAVKAADVLEQYPREFYLSEFVRGGKIVPVKKSY